MIIIPISIEHVWSSAGAVPFISHLTFVDFMATRWNIAPCRLSATFLEAASARITLS
jgi:hypothetical protein